MNRREDASSDESGPEAVGRSWTFVVAAPSSRAGLSSAQLFSELRASARVWRATCSELELPEFAFIGGEERSSVARDGQSVIRIRTGSWCPDRAIDGRDCYSKERAAITHRYPTDSFEEQKQSLSHEADIEINAVHYSWSNEASADDSIRPVLVHELGHVLGLRHSCEGRACRDNTAGRSSVMYPNPLENRLTIPSAADCRTLQELYPSRDVAVPVWTGFGLALALAIFGVGVLRLTRRQVARAAKLN